jgi:hypothetical protein
MSLKLLFCEIFLLIRFLFYTCSSKSILGFHSARIRNLCSTHGQSSPEPFSSTPLRQREPIQILNRSIELRNSSKRMGHFSGKPTQGGAIWVADNAAISFIFPNNAASTRAAFLGTHAGRVKFWLHHPSLEIVS